MQIISSSWFYFSWLLYLLLHFPVILVVSEVDSADWTLMIWLDQPFSDALSVENVSTEQFCDLDALNFHPLIELRLNFRVNLSWERTAANWAIFFVNLLIWVFINRKRLVLLKVPRDWILKSFETLKSAILSHFDWSILSNLNWSILSNLNSIYSWR